MANNPCSDCSLFKRFRPMDKEKQELAELEAAVAEYDALPWWKKLYTKHPDRPVGIYDHTDRGYLRDHIAAVEGNGRCHLKPKTVVVHESHFCGQFRPKA